MIKKKSSLVLITMAICVVVVAFWVCCNYELTKKEQDYAGITDPRNQMSFQRFMEVVTGRESFDMQVFYVPFSPASSEPLEEMHVLLGISLSLSFKSVGPSYNFYFDDILNGFSLSKQNNLSSYDDFTYCCLIKSKSNKYIRFSISKPSLETIFINGEPYEASFELIDSFLKLLPARDYELAMNEIEIIRNTTKLPKGN